MSAWGPFATGSSQQQVRPCPLCPESGSKFGALAAPPRAITVALCAVRDLLNRIDLMLAVQSCLQKFRFALDPNHFISSAVPFRRGALAIVTNVGAGCGGRGSVGRAKERRAGLSRERSTGAQTNGAIRVRQNRVVPTPVAGAKLSVARSIQPDRRAIKPAATVTRRIRSPGRARHKP